jgi:hypothetical protein
MFHQFNAICKVFVAGGLVGVALSSYGQKAGCSVLNVYDPNAFSKGGKIAVSVFEVGGGGVGSNAGPLEKPREILLERFQRDLKKTKYFSEVSVVTPDVTSNADYVLEGNLIGLAGGSQFGRIFVGGFGNAGQMRVSGRILGPALRPGDTASRPVLSDWECNVFGVGKWGFESNEGVTKRNADAVSDALTNQISTLLRGKEGKTKLDKMEAKDESDSDKSPITGKSQPNTRSWRDKQQWQAADYYDEIESFIVRSNEERSRRVYVLWLTQASYKAEAKLVPSLKQTAIVKNREVKPGMLTDLEAVRPFAGQDVIVLVATFATHAKSAPFLWPSKEMRDATYLVRPGFAEARIVPTQFLDDTIASFMVFNEKKVFKGLSGFSAFHPVILVFPTKRPDGTPFIQSTSDVVELHTEVDGCPVQIVFNLKDFDLRNLDELKLASTAGQP